MKQPPKVDVSLCTGPGSLWWRRHPPRTKPCTSEGWRIWASRFRLLSLGASLFEAEVGNWAHGSVLGRRSFWEADSQRTHESFWCLAGVTKLEVWGVQRHGPLSPQDFASFWHCPREQGGRCKSEADTSEEQNGIVPRLMGLRRQSCARMRVREHSELSVEDLGGCTWGTGQARGRLNLTRPEAKTDTHLPLKGSASVCQQRKQGTLKWEIKSPEPLEFVYTISANKWKNTKIPRDKAMWKKPKRDETDNRNEENPTIYPSSGVSWKAL